jgi:hypothetical protein
MRTDLALNGTQFVTLEDALGGEKLAPPIEPEFSVLLVGALKLDANKDNDFVRLYPTDGREDHFYRIRKADIDMTRVERLSPEARAGRGLIAERVFRIRVRPTARVDSVRTQTFEAHQLDDHYAVTAAEICLGTRCAPGFTCVSDGPGKRACVQGGVRVPCNTCTS